MEIIYSRVLISDKMQELKKEGKSIGFVATMGALHKGHISLVEACRKQNDITVVSIFVNPTQFNDKEDLKRYPRMPEKDSGMLQAAGCDFLFIPDEKEIYPEPDHRIFHFGDLEQVMEGRMRPGHFNGVAQVVTRLFDIIKPQRAYFGQKDFQQVAIIRKVTEDLHYPVEIIACPIVREDDGLAMSSRNMLLDPSERKHALVLSKTLYMAKSMMAEHSLHEVTAFVSQHVNSVPGVSLEYFEIVNGKTLLPVKNWNEKPEVIGCIAARVGKIRLIDNINFSS